VEADFWLALWHSGRVGFHQPRVSRYLTEHWKSVTQDHKGRVFVPLCGKSLDLAWLRDQGHFVVGVELSATAIQAFCMESGIAARRRTADRFDVYEASNLELFCRNFFDLDVGHVDNVEAIYDRAALISWSAETRGAYARHMADLTQPGTTTLLITLEYPQEQMAGPPFSVPSSEVERLYATQHSIRELSRENVLEAEPRMRARGLTRLDEVCYRLTRL